MRNVLCDFSHTIIYTHLSEEDRQDDQADPVDDTGELECIINCGHNSERFCAHFTYCFQDKINN